MVKVQTLCRSSSEFLRETKYEIQKVQRNPSADLHPFQKAREYQRALVSTKLNKIFSKPFLGCLTGHSDAVSVMAKCHSNLIKFVSASFDGEIKSWDISQRKCLFSLNAHSSQVKGLSFSYDGQRFLSSGDDKIVNLYDYQEALNGLSDQAPKRKYLSKHILGNVDHNYKDNIFGTSGQIVQIWDYERSQPIQQLEWGVDTILKFRFNPSEKNIGVSTGIDRTIILYDIRGETPIQKISMANKCNGLCWNYNEPMNFFTGSDDSNLYQFDMRKMESCKMIYKGHIGAVMDIDVSPVGTEIVSASYDKTIQIFNINDGHSRETYHGQRMQKIHTVRWSLDNQYILSGSDDMNIRLWKAVAHKQIGTIGKREENATNYKNALVERYSNVREVRKIARHRNLPKYILNANKKKQIQKESKFKKQENRKIHNAKNFQKPLPERAQKVETIQYSKKNPQNHDQDQF